MIDVSLVSIRLAEPRDEPALWLMLTFAASMGEGGFSQIAEAKSDPYLRTYVAGWGDKSDDLGVIAVDPRGQVIGAAWVRRSFGGSRPHVGDPSEPELSIGILPESRAQGLGARLLDSLLTACRDRFHSIVLSVREENPAVRLYQRTGFVAFERIKNRVGGASLVMRRDLGRAKAG